MLEDSIPSHLTVQRQLDEDTKSVQAASGASAEQWANNLEHFRQIATERLATIPDRLRFYGGALHWEERKCWYRL
jgi:hypothetical protein